MALTQTEINEVMNQLQPIIAKALNESTSIQQAQANIQQGVTQYVGARYVPLFADPIEWDSTRAYEPLTIVLHQGNSYTTRQYTPVGIDIANEAFWAQTGNYNAQVELYRQEVKELGDNLALLTNELNDVKITYEKIFGTVNDMKKDTNLLDGMIVKTKGYHSFGDNGGALYQIKKNLTPNDMDIIACANGNFAQLISLIAVPEQYGAYGDGVHDDSNVFTRIFNLENKQIFLVGKYLIGSVVTTTEHAETSLIINGNGVASSIIISDEGSIVFNRARVKLSNALISVLTNKVTDSSNFAITFNNSYDCKISNCEIRSAGRSAIKMIRPAYTYIDECHFSWSSNPLLTTTSTLKYRPLLYVPNGEYLYVNKSSFEGNNYKAEVCGCVIRCGNDVYIDECDFANFPNSQPLVIYPLSSGITRCFVNKTTFIRNYKGSVKLDNTLGYTVMPCIITGYYWNGSENNCPMWALETTSPYYPNVIFKSVLRENSFSGPITSEGIYLGYINTANSAYNADGDTVGNHAFKISYQNICEGGTLA